MKILVFSNIQESTKDNIQGFITDSFKEKGNWEVRFYPPMHEKLIVEVVARSGDILIVKEELILSIFDPKGFYPLNEISGEEKKGDTKLLYLYALPISTEHPLLGKNFNSVASELVAIIPRYTKNKEDAFYFMNQLIKSN